MRRRARSRRRNLPRMPSSRSCSPTTRRSARSTSNGAGATRPRTCCRFRPAAIAHRARRRGSATSRSPMRPWRARPRRTASRSSLISPTSRSMAFSTSWATITNWTSRPAPWNASNARSWRGWTLPIRTRRATLEPDKAAMPDNDAPRRSEPAGSVTERSNLPVPVPRPSEVARDATSWVGRVLRSMFGWKPGSIRADLELVLDAGAGGESGFSPEERAMLKNILGLRERRLDDVMVPRADIIAVQQSIALGELVKVFEGAGHSRLVVYDDTLDDPAGMVHIRDLIAYMTKRAAESAAAKSRRRKPFSAGLDLKAVDL